MTAPDAPPTRAPSLLSRLGIHVESVSEDRTVGRAQLRADHTGGATIVAGHLATLVDVTGGVCAAENATGPVVTADLGLALLVPVAEGTIRAVADPLRIGRRAAVVEVRLYRDEGGEDGALVGLATMTSSRLPVPAGWEEPRTSPGERLRRGRPRTSWSVPPDPVEAAVPLAERLGLRDHHLAAPGTAGCEVELRPEVSNGAGMLHGGMGALLADHTARRAAAAHLARPWCSELNVHYLAPGRTGPFRATARVVGVSDLGVLVRIDVHDAGQQDRPILAATVRLSDGP